MNHLSDRINSLSTSQTLAMAAKARALRAEGKDIIGLSLGEPDFNRSEEHTSELQSRRNLVCRLLLEKKKNNKQ